MNELEEPPVPLKRIKDYSLNRTNSDKAISLGLAEADWYQCQVPRETMRKLLVRRNGPAIRDTLIWFGLIVGFGYLTFLLKDSAWVAIPYLIYAALYASTADSRWHEAGHGTAFRTDWMNNALYEIASFMVMREGVIWRWSHNRHHSDTIIVGRDPEIAVPRPPDIRGLFLSLFALKAYPDYFSRLFLHALGKLRESEKTFIPESEYSKVFLTARIHLGVYLTVIGLAIASRSFLPLFYVGLPHLFGTWLMLVYGLTQHTGLAENVLDHRLNCRTFSTNLVNRFLYWNMNYHVEHHMFPLVPYHAVPALHEAIKNDCPPAHPSLFSCWQEIIPTLRRQVKDPAYHVKRTLPDSAPDSSSNQVPASGAKPDSDGWIEVCAGADLGREDVIRFDYGNRTYALYRDDENQLHATDGVCTHGNTHLADGLVKGKIVECPKHNGRFYLVDGSPARTPICRGLATYPIEERNGRLRLNIEKAGGAGAKAESTFEFRVLENRRVATFITELTLEPINPDTALKFTPGDYLQIDIPSYDEISYRNLKVPEPFASVWNAHHLFDLRIGNPDSGRRNNYSIANNPAKEGVVKFNVRIAMPPPGQNCPPGVGSSYVYALEPGDPVTAIGSFGDFHIKPSQKEMVYIGGGAGMAPLRAHLSHLFENEATARKISFWYGARSKQEIFYENYFADLVETHPNFRFHLALSEPLPEDGWEGKTGFIHEVVNEHYLKDHPSPETVEYYLCGPPMMIDACNKMLTGLGVSPQQIAFDAF